MATPSAGRRERMAEQVCTNHPRHANSGKPVSHTSGTDVKTLQPDQALDAGSDSEGEECEIDKGRERTEEAEVETVSAG